MKRIVKIEGLGNIAFPDSLSDAEVSQVAGRLYDDAKGSTATDAASNAGATGQVEKLADEDTSSWRRIQTADKKHWLIHPEDLPKAQQRDPNLVIHDQ